MDYMTLSIWIFFFLLIIGIFVVIFRNFEKSKLSVEYLVLIAILVAISIVGTLPTAALPGVQASSFIIIMTGIVFGRKIGLFTGVLTPLVMGLFLGPGFWTIFQMIAWGLMGLTAGICSIKLEKNPYLRAGFGFSWGFLFGWITNISMLPFLSSINMTAVLGIYITSFPFDLLHGITNAVLLILFFNIFEKIFKRSRDKLLHPIKKETNII